MIVWGILLRTGLLLYGLWMDTHPVLKYTDIDYVVFSDASRYVRNGQSPYERATYRYTPLLSWILLPNNWNPVFGKVLFSICDILVGLLLHWMLLRRRLSSKYHTLT
jgi:phosphatidylinositol glycan class M